MLCSTILPPLTGPKFAHSLGEASSSPPSFPFSLRSTIEILLGKKLRPIINLGKSWLRASDGWVAWITRLSSHFTRLWIALGIERFIHLTIINISLACVALKLCFKSINYFLLPFGPISISLRDIIVLTGLPIRGADESCLLDIQDSSLLAIEVSSTTQTSYSSTIWNWHDVIEIQSTTKHVEFLWALLCRYVFFFNFGKPAMEYLPIGKTLALGRPYTLGTLLLA